MPLSRLSRTLGLVTLLTAAPLWNSWALAAEPADGDDGAGEVLADSGFRPTPDGFSFENWGGNDHPGSELDGDVLARLLGDEVCARFEDETCVPTPAAEMWIQGINKDAQGGHCAGMAALSAAFYLQSESVDDYGSSETYALTADDTDLLRTISGYFSMQAIEPVASAAATSQGWSLQQTVDELVVNLKERQDYPTIGIYHDGGGHAVTPYRIRSKGPGLFRIDIYDNNYPGAEKYIDIDIANDRWSYAGAALNPSEVAQPWEGGSGTMALLPLEVELQCPFCGSNESPKRPLGTAPQRPLGAAPGGAAAPRRPAPGKPAAAKRGGKPNDSMVLTSCRCSQVLVRGKKDNKTIRMSAKGVESQIAGASMRSLLSGHGCAVQLPRDQEYDVQLVDNGRPSLGGPAGVRVFTPGHAFAIDNVALRPKATETITFSPTNIKFQAGSRQTPTLRFAEDAAGSDGYYEVSGFSIDPGHHFTAEENADGKMAFSDDDPNLDTFDIRAEEVGAERTDTYQFDDVTPGDQGQAILDTAENGAVELGIDSDSDDQPDAVDTDDDNDGTPDAKDTDDDGDGTPDGMEAADADHDGVPDVSDQDDDDDGTPDVKDTDDDGDGTEDSLEAADADHRGDGTADTLNAADTDHDGSPDVTDQDDDNDGTPDVQDSDEDGDGTPDAMEAADTDHDGSPDVTDQDDDNDGIPDVRDSDENGDGTPDSVEGADADHDGTPDATDTDDDNDGVPDEDEPPPPVAADSARG